MTKKQEQLMICPNSKECSPEKRKACGSRHCEIHEEGGACHYDDKIVGCPACIPVEPQPDTCPDCGHPMSEHYSNRIGDAEFGGCYNCNCPNTPADLQPEKQPTQMPLIKPLVLYPPDIFEAFAVFTRKQRDADMTWLPAHDAEVTSKAVKEFAEKVIKTASFYFDDDLGLAITKKDLAEHIRAMAEGGINGQS